MPSDKIKILLHITNLLQQTTSLQLFTRSTFDRFDLNQNGCLDSTELKSCIEYLLNRFQDERFTISEAQVEALLEKYDYDDDGELDFIEFRALIGVFLLQMKQRLEDECM
eukprot:TRINITY_DN11200_c0_g1_i1.p1 TRINITY_DN11200_c0_g1~~TRINITY_DN11200_c0_g1_i1.p1  ORF type:complete len:110 (+),score=22.73 TRINITY_DN11200_c0_g1_i1:41-370(+)